MKVEQRDSPRLFDVSPTVRLADCGRITLDENEQVTFATEAGREYDVVRKRWGFYATPSLNGRLKDLGWRPALVRSPDGRLYIMLVDPVFQDAFESYIEGERHRVIVWFDDPAAVKALSGLIDRHDG